MSILKFKNPETGAWEKVGIPSLEITPENIGAATITQVQAAQNSADNAAQAAQNAQNTATEAKTAAQNAATAAGNAQSTANEAKTNAAAAQSTANEALSAASAVGELSRLHAGLGNEYLWAIPHYSYSAGVGTELMAGTYKWLYRVNNSNLNTTVDLQYGDEIYADADGVHLKNPQVLAVSYNTHSVLESLSGKYVRADPSVNNIGGNYNYGGQILYVGKPTYSSTNGDAHAHWVGFASTTPVYSTVFRETVEYSYVNSPDPNAYPVNDGYTYTPLGMLGDKTKIETGSYVGTGTYGANNKNTLNFSFTPKLVIINNPYSVTPACVMVPGATYAVSTIEGSTMYTLTLTWESNGVSWYGTQAHYQLNYSGREYHYVAIG